MKVALKELERYIRCGEHIRAGRPFNNFGQMRSREALANWLLCAVGNARRNEEMFGFTTDPAGGDGIIFTSSTEETVMMTEHVMVPLAREGKAQDVEKLALDQIQLKVSKGGAAYASGKTLIVLSEAGGGARWHPNWIAKNLPTPLHFDAVWVMSLQGVEYGSYVYGVALLDVVSQRNAPTWSVRIQPDFEGWAVEDVQ